MSTCQNAKTEWESAEERRERLKQVASLRERVIDNLLVRIHFIIVMIRWTGLAP